VRAGLSPLSVLRGPRVPFRSKTRWGRYNMPSLKGICFDSGPASEGSGLLFGPATVTDCDSNYRSKQVALNSKRKFYDRALLCQGPGLSPRRAPEP
jgi:hypothetical protein